MRTTREIAYVFRPLPARPDEVQALAGLPVHATRRAVTGGDVLDVVLQNGSRVQASRAELVAE